MTAHPRRESRDPAKRNGFEGFFNANGCATEIAYEPGLGSGWYWRNLFCRRTGWSGPFRSSRAAYRDAIKGG